MLGASRLGWDEGIRVYRTGEAEGLLGACDPCGARRNPDGGCKCKPIAGVQQTGRQALRKLASVNKGSLAAIARARGIDAVVAGIGAHTAIAGVEKEGGRSLRILECRTGENRRRY